MIPYYVIFILITIGTVAIIGGVFYYCLAYGNVIDLEIHA